MRLHKRLSVAGEPLPLPLVDEDLRLDLFAPGRAAFTVQSTAAVSGLVWMDLGYQLDRLQRFFLGYVVHSQPAGDDRQKSSPANSPPHWPGACRWHCAM